MGHHTVHTLQYLSYCDKTKNGIAEESSVCKTEGRWKHYHIRAYRAQVKLYLQEMYRKEKKKKVEN